MTDTTAIMYAGMAAWLGISLYLFILARKQAALIRRMDRINQLAPDSPARGE